MIRDLARWAAVGVFVASSSVAGAADSPVGPKVVDTKPWYARLLGDNKSKPEPPVVKPTQRPSIIIAPLTPDVLAESVRAEQAALTRRLDVCAKLRDAAGTDDALLQQIDELERQALELCQARVARMGVRTSATAKPRPSAPVTQTSIPTPPTPITGDNP